MLYLELCRIVLHEYVQAMDQLLALLKTAPDSINGAPREMIITIIRMLTPTQPELAREFQRKFSSLMA